MTAKRKHGFLPLLAAAIVAAAVFPAVSAEPTLVDRVVAVVEDEAIFESDVETMVRQTMLQQGKSSLDEAERKQLSNKILHDMINDKLVIAQASRLDIDIPFSEVEERVDKAIAENTRLLGGEAAFRQQLEREGFTMDSLKKLYRDQIRNRMLVERVLSIEVDRGHIEISDADLRAFYEERKAELPKRPAVVHLKTIFVGFESSGNAKTAAKEKIDDIYDRAAAGEPFAELAKKYSEDPSASLGGDLGFVKPGDLRDPEFAEAAAKLEVGEISKPVLTQYGYHIIQLVEKRPETGEIRIRHILVRLSASENDVEEIFSKVKALRARIEAGESFESLADEYSADPTASEGGDLGWLRVADLPEFFRDVLATMKPGDVSQVLRESRGFRIVKLIGREEERPYEYEEVKPQLTELLRQQRLEVAYNEYIEGLRKKFSVEIK